MKKLIPNSGVAERYGVVRETVWRWKNDPKLNFPKPAAVINGTDYFDSDALDAFDAATLERQEAQAP
jgi:hypothetical protein